MEIHFNIPGYEKVYLYIGEDFDSLDFTKLDIDKMIDAVAKSNIVIEGTTLFDTSLGKVNRHKTKQAIVNAVDRFIFGMNEISSDDVNIAHFASIRQLENLAKIKYSKNKKISCHSFIYIYVMFLLIKEEVLTEELPDYYECSKKLETLIHQYYEQDIENKLAPYVLKTTTPVINALHIKNRSLSIEELPPIERYHPRRKSQDNI